MKAVGRCIARTKRRHLRHPSRRHHVEAGQHALWLRDPQGRLLLHRESAKRREGLWKLPTREAAALSALPILDEQRYSITRYRVTLRVHDGTRLGKNFRPSQDEVWHSGDEVLALAMPSPFRRAIERLLERI